MRGHFVHQVSLLMDADADTGAPGAAVTLELCGSWEHGPPCPLAPHHTSPQRKGGAVTLRIVFAAEPEQEEEVRRRIDKALAAGSITGPGRAITRWTLRDSQAGELSSAELAHAQRIAET
jgi:hypothetical protein